MTIKIGVLDVESHINFYVSAHNISGGVHIKKIFQENKCMDEESHINTFSN